MPRKQELQLSHVEASRTRSYGARPKPRPPSAAKHAQRLRSSNAVNRNPGAPLKRANRSPRPRPSEAIDRPGIEPLGTKRNLKSSNRRRPHAPGRCGRGEAGKDHRDDGSNRADPRNPAQAKAGVLSAHETGFAPQKATPADARSRPAPARADAADERPRRCDRSFSTAHDRHTAMRGGGDRNARRRDPSADPAACRSGIRTDTAAPNPASFSVPRKAMRTRTVALSPPPFSVPRKAMRTRTVALSPPPFSVPRNAMRPGRPALSPPPSSVPRKAMRTGGWVRTRDRNSA